MQNFHSKHKNSILFLPHHFNSLWLGFSSEMVQRKSPNKLGIQTDSNNYDKSEKRATVSEPSCSQPPEARNKGGSVSELKKMMKKSGSIKRSEFDILRSNSMRRRANSRAEKRTDAVVPTQKPTRFLVTPQKVPQVKTPENSPSYMKPTSSSSARKERAKVSLQNSKTSDSKTPSRKTSITPKPSSGSDRKPGKTLTKSASIRPVRILTKTFSIKPRRTSMKKNSGVALGTDQEVRRATCSSTLKDSKFPPNVSLHSGGTESEGTSVMKVCPYNYCSLNGHHHAELPPLKSFLSAKRRLLKTQKSIRLRNLPSIRRRSSGKPKEDVSRGQRVCSEDHAIPEEGSTGSEISPSIEEEDWYSFVEIYTQPEENTTQPIRRTRDDRNDRLKNLFRLEDISSAESLSDDSSYSTVSFEDYIDNDIEFTMDEMDVLLFSEEYIQMEEAEDKNHSAYTTQTETGECEINGTISDKSGTACKEGEVGDGHSTSDDDCFIPTSDKHDRIVCLHEIPSNEAPQFDHVESTEYLQEEFHGPDKISENESSNKISSEESNTSSCSSLSDSLPSTDIPSDATEYLSEGPVHTLLEDENSKSHTHDEHESQLEEQKYDSSDLEIHRSIVLDDPTVDADVHLFLHEENVVENGAGVKEKEEERNIFISKFPEEDSYTEECNLKSVEEGSTEGVEIEAEDGSGTEQTTATDDEFDIDQEHLETYIRTSKPIRRKKETEEPEEPREFNPRGPRFLPLDPEEDPETVDLRHQTVDERRNSEEWMVDYALRETVRKLTRARSRKVKLLVEAFETVPIPDYETHLPHTTTDLSNTSFMQSCN